MTNKTINGVPRAQIQRTLSALSEVGKIEPDYIYVGEVVRELRALLAAPDPAKCQNCGLSTAEQCDDIGCSFLRSGNGAPDPAWVRDMDHRPEELGYPELEPVVEADGIGEPVAYRCFDGEGNFDYWDDSKEAGGNWNFSTEPLYSADQLAALQSTISQLQARIAELESRVDGHQECSGNSESCSENEGFGCCVTPSGNACPGDGVNACKKCPQPSDSPPAQVAVVLPDREPVTVGLLSESNTYNQGWNACLDEVRRMNP